MRQKRVAVKVAIGHMPTLREDYRADSKGAGATLAGPGDHGNGLQGARTARASGCKRAVARAHQGAILKAGGEASGSWLRSGSRAAERSCPWQAKKRALIST
jgi:hypothetical protein